MSSEGISAAAALCLHPHPASKTMHTSVPHPTTAVNTVVFCSSLDCVISRVIINRYSESWVSDDSQRIWEKPKNREPRQGEEEASV